MHRSLLKLQIERFIWIKKSFLQLLGYFRYTIIPSVYANHIFLYSSESRTILSNYLVLRKKFIWLMRHLLVIEHFNRMSHNSSQLGHVPSESSLENHHTETNIDQLLTINIVTTNLFSLEVETTTATVVNTTPPVPNGTLPNTPTTR